MVRCTTSVSPFVMAQGHENLLLHRSTFDATGVVEIMTLPADSEPEVRLISELRFEDSHASHEQVFFPGTRVRGIRGPILRPRTAPDRDIFLAPTKNVPVPNYRSEASAIAIWRHFPSKLDKMHLIPVTCYRIVL
jgi:hypothetical protein